MTIEHTYTDEMRLSWDEYQNGEHCRGCDRPLRDDQPWEFRGTNNMNPAERQRYDGEERRYSKSHQGRHAHRWSIDGSLTTHCGRRCPPPPLSPNQITKLVQLLRPPV
jgi:hypothetical protein